MTRALYKLCLRIEITYTKRDSEEGVDNQDRPDPGLEGEPDALPVLYPFQFFPMLRQYLLHLLVRLFDEFLLVCEEFAMNTFDRLDGLVIKLNCELLPFEFFQKFSGIIQRPLDDPGYLKYRVQLVI